MWEKSICRICLASDIRLHDISGTPLQLFLEKMLSEPLHATDQKQPSFCTYCRWQLLKGYNFMKLASQADRFLAQLDFDGVVPESPFKKALQWQKLPHLIIPTDQDIENATIITENTENKQYITINKGAIERNNKTKLRTRNFRKKSINIKNEETSSVNEVNFEDKFSKDNAETRISNTGYAGSNVIIDTVVKCDDTVKSTVNEHTNRLSLNNTKNVSLETHKAAVKSEVDDGINLQTISMDDHSHFDDNDDPMRNVKSGSGDESLEAMQYDTEDELPLKTISSARKTVKARKKTDQDKKLQQISAFAREIQLTREEQLAELHARAKSSNYVNAPLRCETCFRGFVDTRAYDNHREKHSETSGPHSCEICRLRYHSVRQLRSHEASAHSRRFACRRCAHVSHTANQARDHEKWHGGHTYPCKLCGQKFSKPTSYLTHMRKRHPAPHVCALCGDGFVGAHGLSMHTAKAHFRDRPSPSPSEPASARMCVPCGVQFASVDAWKRHMLNMYYTHPHSNSDGYVFIFLSTGVRANVRPVRRPVRVRGRLEALTMYYTHPHSNTDGGHCLICGARSESPSWLTSHLRRHERELSAKRRGPPLQRPDAPEQVCDQCGAHLSSRSSLRAHVRTAHLGLKYDKHLVCEQCGKKCTSNASLRYHQRTHTGEKPYACAECPKRFVDSNQRRIHARSHSGERPYGCDRCGRRFSQKPALNRHYRVHTGDKPYSCQYCPKSFSQTNSLKLHVQKVHLKIPAAARDDAIVRCNVIGRSNDVIGRSNDVIGGSSDVVVRSNNVTGRSNDVIGGNDNVISRSNDGIGRSNDVISGSDNVIGRSSNVIGGSSDVVVRSNNVIGRSNDVIGASSDVVVRSNNVIGQGSDKIGRCNDIVKGENTVTMQAL